jgi:hypothetical protein
VRNLSGVLTGTTGVVNSLPINAANGIPQLDVNGKILVSQLPNSVMEYKGTWNAATNTPTLVNGTGNQGDVYLCNVAGTVDFGAGAIAFVVGDQVIYSGSIWQRASGATGTVTSVAITESGDSLNITGSPITTSGTINIGFNGTNLQYVNGAGNLTTFPTLITSIGLSMPSAFSVANSPLTANGTIAVTGAGVASQYIRGDGTLADFPSSGGGGSSVSYYLNGGTSQGTIGGTTYYEMSKTAVVGTGVDFAKSGDGFIVAFLTDANDPAQLNIPAGNWNYEIYASMSSNGGTPQMYAELYKYDGTTFTLISTSSNEIIYDGTALNLYTFAMAVPATSLTLTDRLAVKLYATNSGGKTTTIHTQDGHLCQIITTFSTGITALNGLTAQVQYFQTGTSGTDFNISSATATHTFNIPTASAANRGALSSADWSTFNGKVPYTGANANVTLGVYSLTANQLIAGGAGVNNVATFTTYDGGVATQLIGSTGNLKFFPLWNPSIGARINAENTAGSAYTPLSFYASIFYFNSNVNFASTIGNGTYTYTLPSATGTLALTTDLGAYLPLAGGTLTGALSGTSATFSGVLKNTGDLIVSQGNNGSWTGKGLAMAYSVGSDTGLLYSYDYTGGVYKPIKIIGSTIVLQVSAIEALTIASTGAATFSSSVFSLRNNIGTGTSDDADISLNVSAPSGSGKYIMFGRNGSNTAVFSISSAGVLGATQLNATTTTAGYAAILTNTNGAADSNGLLVKAGSTSSEYVVRFAPQSDASTFFTVKGNGNVGIGTSSPNDLLEIKATTANQGNLRLYNTFNSGASSYGISWYRDYDSATNSLACSISYARGGGSDGDMKFSTGSVGSITERMRITSGGNVLIGTTTDGGTHKLQVNGSIIATGFFESSDSRLKTLIQDNYQTKGITSITPKLYTKNGKVELGYYAQDFVGILDSAVSKGSDDMLSLSYREVHTAKIYALEQEIKELKAKMN